MGMIAILIVSLGLCISSVRAGIEKYVDNETVFAAEADLNKLDPAAVTQFLADLSKTTKLAHPPPLGPSRAQIKQGLENVQRWLTETQAHGAGVIYAVSTAELIKDGGWALIVPVDDAQAKTMASLLYSGSTNGSTHPSTKSRGVRYPLRAEAVKGVGAVLGIGSAIAYVRTLKPSPRPELQAALEAAGDAPIKLALIPTRALRNLLQEQNEPAAVSQIDALLGSNVKWTIATITPPPHIEVRAVVQAGDAASARRVSDLIAAALKDLTRQGFTAEFTALLKPTREGDQLVLSLDEKQIQSMSRVIVKKAQEQALRVRTLSNMRHILMACFMYTYDGHHGAWPDRLEVLKPYLRGHDAVLSTNPARPDAHPPYVYIKPKQPLRNPGEMIVMYEAHQKFVPGVAAGFADGHVEFIANKDRFERMLAHSRELVGN